MTAEFSNSGIPSRGEAVAERERVARELGALTRESWRLEGPVDLEPWAALMHIRLRVVDQVPEGRYSRRPHPTIFLRAGRPATRQRFTFAHELGHHVLEEARRNKDFRR